MIKNYFKLSNNKTLLNSKVTITLLFILNIIIGVQTLANTLVYSNQTIAEASFTHNNYIPLDVTKIQVFKRVVSLGNSKKTHFLFSHIYLGKIYKNQQSWSINKNLCKQYQNTILSKENFVEGKKVSSHINFFTKDKQYLTNIEFFVFLHNRQLDKNIIRGTGSSYLNSRV